MTTKTYNMGHTRKHVFPTPSKIRFTEHNGRTICANPSGVPAKWLPIYLELASRMYDNGPSFAIGKDENERGNPVTLRLKDECGSWSTIGDPKDAARYLEMAAPAKPAPRKVVAPKAEPKTRVVRPGSGVPAYREIINPADEMVTELVEHFGKSPADAHALVDEICVEESWPRPVWTPNSPAVQAASDARVDFMMATTAPVAQPASQAMAQLPQWAEEWLAGLVFETKRDYARQFLAHLLCDAPAPECPGTEWAEKARKRARRLAEIAAA